MTTNIAKRLVIIIVLSLGIFIFGIISVDERQKAVVINLVNKKSQILSPGLHFVWPIIDKINYIFMNKRNGLLTINLNFPDNSNVEIEALVEWQVINPQIYLAAVKQDTFNKELTDSVRQLLETRAKTTNLSTFNQLYDMLSQPLPANSLGIQINHILLNELSVADTPKQIKPIISQVVVRPIAKTATIPQSSIEEAYYQAQMIKTKTEIEQARMYQSLEAKNLRFYAYFRKLQIYKISAKTKEDMPPMEDLYK